LIIQLGRWTVHESCRQLREWQRLHPDYESLTVSVNLSCREFMQFNLAEQVAATLIATQLDPRCLKLEITESHIMENSELAVKIMNRLRALGVEMSLDDFGTGYSSLSYLHRLPANFLKIDRSFVSRMVETGENREIIYTIIKLAQNLKMKVIAEGIETEGQFEHLAHLKCDYGQGYLFSRPLEAEAAKEFIIGNTKSLPFPVEYPSLDLELEM
jgi:EAL domain-containing protein (putative c-di-GMP-specific phosphodiesterase class I)